MKSSTGQDPGSTDLENYPGNASTFCHDVANGTRCDCPGYSQSQSQDDSLSEICRCGHSFCAHDIVRASAEIACRLHGLTRTLVCLRGQDQKVINFGLDGSWTAKVKLVPSPDMYYGFWPQDARRSVAYFRLMSRGLVRRVKFPGPDHTSITSAVSEVFGDILRGRSWMPLFYRGDRRRLCQFGAPNYNIQFLIEHCITDWFIPGNSSVTFDINLEDNSLSWDDVRLLPLRNPNYEIFWEPECYAPTQTSSGSQGVSESSNGSIRENQLPIRPRQLHPEEEEPITRDVPGVFEATEEFERSPESSHYDTDTESTATATTDSGGLWNESGELVERSVRLNRTNLTNQVLIYIKWLIQGIIIAGESTRDDSNKAKQPPGTFNGTGSSSTPNSQNRKRTFDANQQGEDATSDGEDERGNLGGAGMSSAKALAVPQRNFACPFFKHNPSRYMSWRSCPGPGWNSVHRVKEHLYRRHLLPKFACDRCFESFQDTDALRVHHRAQTQCPLRDEPPEGPDGVTPAQEIQLRSRKRSRLGSRDTEHEKWVSIYTILFPGEPEIPSPYYDYERTNYDNFPNQKLPPLLQEELRQFVEQEIEEELCAIPSRVKEKLKTKVIDAVQKFQPILLKRYQEFLAEAGAVVNHPIDSHASNEDIRVEDPPGFRDIVNHPIDSRGSNEDIRVEDPPSLSDRVNHPIDSRSSNEDICVEDPAGFHDIDWAGLDLDAIWEQPIQAPPPLQPSSAA